MAMSVPPALPSTILVLRATEGLESDARSRIDEEDFLRFLNILGPELFLCV
jgi:hypothetical protein